MTALCPNASLETLWPLCYRGTHCLQRDLCRCFHQGSLQALQVVVTLSPRHVLQNSPQFIVQGVEVWLPEGQSLALIKAETFLRSHSWVVLAMWTGAESCWKTHFWPLKTVVLRRFTSPFSTSFWYTWAPLFTPFSQKWRGVTSWWDAPPPNHDVGRLMASCTLRTHLKGCLSINLFVLVVILLLDDENFLVHEEDVFVPILGVPLE